MSKFLALCLRLGLVLVLAATVAQAEVHGPAADKELPPMAAAIEQTTESPVADMALIEDAPVVPKLPTEKPPMAVAAATPTETTATAPAKPQQQQQQQQPEEEQPKAAQPHTVADFIIHPLIAFKPRQAAPEELQAQGKQATPAGGSAGTSSPGTWLFGMNPGQGIGSSFSTLAGSVSGWFNDRLAAAGQQLPALPGLPALVDTPVRDSAATTTTSTSTTTQRPDIVVRLQQRPNRRRGNNNNANGNGIRNGNLNGNGIRNGNGNGNRGQRPNRFNNHLNSLESLEEYDDVDYFNDNRYDEEFYDEEQDAEADADELALNEEDQSLEDDEQQQQQQQQKQQQKQKQKQKQRRRPAQAQVVRRKQQTQQTQLSQRRQQTQQVRRGQVVQQQQQQQQQVSDEEEEVEEDDDDADADAELEDDDDNNEEEEEEENYAPVIYTQSSRRSQSQAPAGFIQSGQQSLINQIRRFTFGQTPAELGNQLRKSQSSQSPSRSGTRRPQQTTLLVNRNGQTVYVAPELLHLSPSYASYPGYPSYTSYAPPKVQQKQQKQQQRVPVSPYPQPPLTVPLRRKGRPTQYITIPWSQLGLSAPERQSVVSLGEGIQGQPLIFNIPESAISSVPAQKKKKRPTLTAAAVPLLADASLMDIFQPPQIPPSRTGSSPSSSSSLIAKPKPKPVLIAAKPVQAGSAAGLLPTRIRPATIVEKAPAVEAVEKPQSQSQLQSQLQSQSQSLASSQSSSSQSGEQQQEKEVANAGAELQMDDAQATPEQEFIIVGEDNEPGLSRHVQPVYGDARYVSYGDFQPYFDLVHQNRRFALRKVGRALESESESASEAPMDAGDIAADSPIVRV